MENGNKKKTEYGASWLRVKSRKACILFFLERCLEPQPISFGNRKTAAEIASQFVRERPWPNNFPKVTFTRGPNCKNFLSERNLNLGAILLISGLAAIFRMK